MFQIMFLILSVGLIWFGISLVISGLLIPLKSPALEKTIGRTVGACTIAFGLVLGWWALTMMVLA